MAKSWLHLWYVFQKLLWLKGLRFFSSSAKEILRYGSSGTQAVSGKYFCPSPSCLREKVIHFFLLQAGEESWPRWGRFPWGGKKEKGRAVSFRQEVAVLWVRGNCLLQPQSCPGACSDSLNQLQNCLEGVWRWKPNDLDKILFLPQELTEDTRNCTDLIPSDFSHSDKVFFDGKE